MKLARSLAFARHIPPRQIAEAVLMCATGAATGQAYTCQPGRDAEAFHFGGVPGPRVPGAEGMRPPLADLNS